MPDTYMVNGNLSGIFDSPFMKPPQPVSGSGNVGYLQGICLGGMTDMYGTGTTGVRHLQLGLTKSLDEGNPSTPSLKITYPGMWRFRWTVKPGIRTVSINTKQDASGYPLPQRPTMKVKSNSDVGLLSDISSSAPTGSSWVTIGPLSFTAASLGMVWVEVWNNLYQHGKPAYFDHIVVS